MSEVPLQIFQVIKNKFTIEIKKKEVTESYKWNSNLSNDTMIDKDGQAKVWHHRIIFFLPKKEK